MTSFAWLLAMSCALAKGKVMEPFAVMAKSIEVARRADSVGDALKRLQAESIPVLDSDSDSWSVDLGAGVSAKAVSKELRLSRGYLISGDVHQENFGLGVWKQDVPDEHGPMIHAPPPEVGRWRMDTRGERPKGPLPKVSDGPSPAYDLEKYDTLITSVTFTLVRKGKH